ncbi:MAG: family 20 glycosylhydrolase, partial [Gemmatimonadota bacterium]
TFHWHLTEDQGWRLEIERYPRLTTVGSCRAETQVGRESDPFVGDGERYCGHYTQAEAREIVEYARERFITVLPEIEMPGHSRAALAAYPELACTDGPFEVGTRWGVYEDIYCPGERTFAFLEDVLTEVMAVFPSEVIHIGGDEAPKARWEESPVAQRVIEREGLEDEEELQGWFVARIGRFLAEHGRRLVGWDEILEGGLAPDAVVMSWRGVEGGIEAVKAGLDVVMTPTSHAYFDYYQGDPEQEPLAIGGHLPLEEVYEFEPVPDALSADEARHVLGAQGNVWTEYMRTPEHVEYMVFPRLLAMAEVVWTPRDARDRDGFMRRLGRQLRRLDARGVNYRVPDVTGLERDRLTLDDRVVVELRSPVPDAEIRYTLDGSEPDRDSRLYTGPLRLDVDTSGITVAARLVLPDGRRGHIRRARFARATLRPPADDVAPRDLAPGLRRRYFEGEFRTVGDLRDSTLVRTDVVEGVGLKGDERAERFGLRLTGYLRIPADGVYTFRLSSDDGAVLRIGGRTVVDHDGLHGMSARDGPVALARGLHPVELLFFQAGGGRGLRLEMARAGREPAPIPDGWWRRRPGG